MKKLFPHRPSPALVVAVVALFSSLASGATAAKLLTGKQIKDRSITGKDLKPKSLTGKHVKDGSLAAADFAKGVLGAAGVAGPMGPAGPAGADGAEGLPGADGVDGVDGARGSAGADGVDGARGPAGADGAAGATGPAGPPGPAGPQGPAGGNVIASGYHSLGPILNLGAGSTDLLGAAFTASASGVCVVTAQVMVDNNDANANNSLGIQTIRKVNGGANTADGGWTHYVMADGDSEGSGSKTATHAITEGSTYQFGGRLQVAGDSVGDFAYPTVTYFCL